MIIKEVTAKLEKEYPCRMAMDWDNPGLQVGRPEREVRKVFVALDATEEVIRECVAWGAELLVTHHPLLMSGIKKVNSEGFPGRKVLELAENGIAHYALHTNYDVSAMREIAQEMLKLKNARVLDPTEISEDGTVYGIGCIGDLTEEMTGEECCLYVKSVFSLESIRLFGRPDAPVRKMAVCPGSGKSVIGAALALGADVLVTGDIGHHDGLDGVDQQMLMIDAGHYGVEHIFIRQMASLLRASFPELEVREAEERSPFIVY